MPLMTNTFMPMGGVIRPSSTTITTRMPNQTGSKFKLWTMGKKIGMVSRIMARASSTQPMTM